MYKKYLCSYKHLMLFSVIFTLLVAIPCLGITQVESSEDDQYDFIYIDNSKPRLSEDGITYEMLSNLSDLIDTIKINPKRKFLLFRSNGTEYSTFSQQDMISTENILAAIQDPVEIEEKKHLEKRRIKDEWFEAFVENKNKIHFHFYVTNYFCDILRANPAYLLSMLPMEFYAMAPSESEKLLLYIHFPEVPSGGIKFTEVKQLLKANLDFFFDTKSLIEDQMNILEYKRRENNFRIRENYKQAVESHILDAQNRNLKHKEAYLSSMKSSLKIETIVIPY